MAQAFEKEDEVAFLTLSFASGHHQELFGFDRPATIVTHSAEEIARAARQFGQEDDITVLTLTLVPETVAHV